MTPNKLSEYENGKFRPTLQHTEAFCRVYGVGPEELGLITWRAAEECHQAWLENEDQAKWDVWVELGSSWSRLYWC